MLAKPVREKLSPKETRILEFVKQYYRLNNKMPSMREMMVAFDRKSPRAITYWMDRLHAKGYIAKVPKSEFRRYKLID